LKKNLDKEPKGSPSGKKYRLRERIDLPEKKRKFIGALLEGELMLKKEENPIKRPLRGRIPPAKKKWYP